MAQVMLSADRTLYVAKPSLGIRSYSHWERLRCVKASPQNRYASFFKDTESGCLRALATC
jgi:hypothetical protein